jgi:hypothetical protein
MSSWYGQIQAAPTIADVVAIVRDYIALWSPEEMAMLPAAARPGRVRDASDVTDLHERLVEEYRTTRASGEALATLQRFTGFLVRASLRMAELARDEGEREAARREARDEAQGR